jgi:hypothetical protein
VLGGGGQQATQIQATTESSGQQLDPTGGQVVGGAQQANGQQSNTDQGVDQTESGTFVVFGGGLHQQATQVAQTVLDNDQSVDGATVDGSVDQSNQQSAAIGQGIDQSLTGTFVVFGGTVPVDPSVEAGFAAVDACDLCADALSDASVGLVGGNLRQNAGSNQSLNGTYVVLGNLDQSFDQDSTVDEANDQTVSGSIILGNVSQANVQHANVGQSINQSLSGTYIVFGTLDQSASQLALIHETNIQIIQGG